MSRDARALAGFGLLWLVLALVGGAAIARLALEQRREAFETDARIAHRLLSQRAVQQEAIVATLALLQPGAVAGEVAPEQRLPSLYPQVLRVLRRGAGQAWPADGAAALQAGEVASRQAGRVVLAAADFAAGHFTVVQAAEPASFALQIDVRAFVPQVEWPFAPDGRARVVLEHGGQTHVLAPGRGAGAAGGDLGWDFGFRKHLAAESQPFDVVAGLHVGWAELPWGAIAAWLAASGAAVGLAFGALRQRAERRRAQELLRLGQVGRLNALGELAAGMAHELNQPLTAVLANAQAAQRMLADDPPELDAARGAIDQAARQARRAAEVIGRLRRTVERPQGGADRVAVRLDDTVRQALDLLEPDTRRLGVVPVLDVDPAARTVQAEPVALEQIVHNLLTNALHALGQVPPGDRQLTLRVAVDGDNGVLTVRDTGPGIAPEALPRLFEPFFSTREGGLGLGLSLCETLAAGMGGTLTGGNAPGRGAEFRLVLPLRPAAA
jgi:signal transduction histidine kinase